MSDMTYEKWSKIPTLFKRGDKGIVIPEINPLASWVLDSDQGLMTIKIDGVMVKVTLEAGIWCIHKRMSESAFMKTNKDDTLDKPLWEAFDLQDVKTNGIFEVYGKDIKGNPYNMDKNRMIKIFPVDYSLMVAKSSSTIKRGWGVPVQMLFDTIKAELTESPEIEGIVWHLEQPSGMELKAAGKIKRSDFGLTWPPKYDKDIIVIN